jgi:CCR4-NOT transcription complex subunit 1
MHALLVDFLGFLSPHIAHRHLNNTSKSLYRAALRILSILLHDFPDFLCGYHHSLVNTLPINCIQLKNLILSAFPPDMRLPDPFTPNLKVDLLPETSQPPKILIDFTSCLETAGLKKDIDNYLRTRSPVTFLKNLSKSAFVKKSSGYDIPLINTLVLYIGTIAIAQAKQKQIQGSPPIAHNVSMDIFQFFLVDLNPEGMVI